MMFSNGSDKGRRTRRLVRASLVLLLAGGGVAVAAEQIVVRVSAVQVRASKSGFGGIVGTLKQNDKVEVIAREGDWLKVRTPSGGEGYVKEGALSARSLAPAPAAFATGDARSSGAAASLATKGLEQGALDYAASRNFRTDGVETMITTHRSITPEEFERFEQEGKVGSAKAW